MISNRLTLAALTLFTVTASSQTAPTATKKPATTTTTHSTATTAAATHTATPATAAVAAPACSKLPELSPKIPALPPGSPCAKPLYTITTVPSVRLDYVSPLENPGLREELGLEPTSFSLDYIDTKIGTGALAAPHKFYTVHYTGYLLDGTKFDSSVDRGQPITIEYGKHQVIPGWDTGFDGMHVGGKRRLFIPYQLAYGANGQGPIPARAELVFDVELVAQSDTDPKPPAPMTGQGSGTAKPATDPDKPTAEPAKPESAPQTPPNPNL